MLALSLYSKKNISEPLFTYFTSDLDPRYAFCMLWVRKMCARLAKVVENGRFVLCCGKMCQTSMSFTSFIGQAQTAIDGKGRSSFPREFRRQLEASDGKEFVVTRGPAQTLRLFTVPEYEKFMADLDSRSDRRQADLVRRSLWPTVVELDGQNRILLPKILLEYAGLKGDVLYVQASGKTLELWNPERYNAKYGLESDDAIAAFDAAFYGESLTEGLDGKK